MSLLPKPPENTLTWRPWTSEDTDALVRHMERVHEAERLEHVDGADSFRWIANQPDFDPALDSLVAFDTAGEVRAEAGVWAHISDEGSRVFIWAHAAPPFTNLRPFLISWGEARARQKLVTANPDRDRIIRMGVEEHRTSLRREIEDAGFFEARSFAVMRRPLAGLPAAPTLPDGIRVQNWSADVDSLVRSVNNESFADHWGSMPINQEAWTAAYRDSENFRPSLSFVAMSGDDVVSFCLAEVSNDDTTRKGRAEVYIARVGTRRAHRRGGLASHLVVRTMEAAADTGMDVAALDVDESSHTNATAVYARLGFEVVERSIHYIKKM